MIRQRNDTGGVLESHEFGLSIGPGEEFDCSLPVPGCTPVPEDPEDDPPATPPGDGSDPEATA